MLEDRAAAGRALAARLMHLRDAAPVVLALPRGGVPVAFEVAAALGAPLDILLVRKIGAPHFPELAAGAVLGGAHPGTVINEAVVRELGISEAYLEREAARQRAEITRRSDAYLRGRPPLPVENRTVIVVDDGAATGATARVALRMLRAAGLARRVVLAVPVAAPEVAAMLRGLCDDAVFLALPDPFGAVGRFYEDFTQVEDAVVIDLLDRAATRQGG
ncbi:phosphoribosyltransferase [Roseomonas marmotae]|uniref:Phosphoribosyltransferase n=2 Tax=Roseomonas marmotae TaxID=2768161 RepID=A0ABS3KFJ9_9PROT|nr:phosphoribosyltransferase [Roseomonas marmotae]QTI80903.1 phosphoribosyltransferase [Roseomonas marmotae]